MHTCFSGYTRRDWITALCLTLVLLVLAGMQLTCGMSNWGDDFAAYINEGIAISTGTLEEMTAINYIMHTAPLTEEATEETLVYVWGYPLVLSLVHRLAGFDRVGFSSIIWYKLPSLIALALTAGLMYLYYRRRFQTGPALLLAILLCFHTIFISAVNWMFVDVLFLFLFQLSLLLAECWFDMCLKPPRPGRTAALGAALGLAMWYTCMTRLNGSTVLLVVGLGHGILLCRNRQLLSSGSLLRQCIPYLVMGAAWFTGYLFLPEATSNLSDVGKVTAPMVAENIQYYLELLREYCDTLVANLNLALWPLMLFLTVLGLIRKGFSPENLPLTVLFASTFCVLLLLPYTQGLRYLFNILPVILLFAAQGGRLLLDWLNRKGLPFRNRLLLRGTALAVVLLILIGHTGNCLFNLKNQRRPDTGDVYSEDAVELYHYIREQLPEDAVIGFCKPRALYLNTQRMSICPGVNGHVLEDGDYFLFCITMYTPQDWQIVMEQKDSLEPVWSNDSFLLYEVVD